MANMAKMTLNQSRRLSALMAEIEDRSLQQILRAVVFGGDDVDEAIEMYRPETLQERQIEEAIDVANDMITREE